MVKLVKVILFSGPLDIRREVCYLTDNKIRVEFYSIMLLFATQ